MDQVRTSIPATGPKVGASMIGANLLRLGEEIDALESAGAAFVHVDVSDGHFLRAMSFGLPTVRAVAEVTNLPIDVHLMAKNPQFLIEDFFDAGATSIIVHDVNGLEPWLRPHADKLSVGISLDCNMEEYVDVCHRFSRIVLLGAAAGVSGAKFDEKVLENVKMLREHEFKGVITVDGGIGFESGPLAASAGADELVSGSALFKSDDYRLAIRRISSMAPETAR